MSNTIDMTGWTSGTVILGQIVQSSPRRYAARCNQCNTTFTQDHHAMKLRLDRNLSIECPNEPCRRGLLAQVAREKEYFRQLRQTERDADNAATEDKLRARYGPQVTAVTS